MDFYSVEYGRFREMCRIRVRLGQNTENTMYSDNKSAFWITKRASPVVVVVVMVVVVVLCVYVCVCVCVRERERERERAGCTRGGWCGQSVVLASAGKYAVDGMTPKSSRQELGPVSHLQLAPNRQFRCTLSMLH